ncbi:hypothetical protein LTR62_002848 [Meristemomyces frigidus]|uniref:RING-type domain-containing protein n=1 Tax=Meristemomyces frigidus TaxID=1508187 RepID=A0AAN7TWZ9_9PEZI|nr:hypothetical protein LTR62_002848 [Meristemomyces frigidus]
MGSLGDVAVEVANSLALDDVPAKLRCANCNKLCIEGVKLPCCDQNICGPCSKDLSDTCPVCQHNPISGDECKLNKTLRVTINAFIKTELKKREKAAAPAIVAAPVVQSIETPVEHGAVENAASPPLERSTSAGGKAGADGEVNEPGTRTATADQNSNGAPADGRAEESEYASDDEDDVNIITEHQEESGQQYQQQEHQQQRQSAQNGYTDGAQQAVGQEHDLGSGMEDQQGNNVDNYDQQRQQNGFGNGGMNNFNNMGAFNPMMMGMGGFGGMGMPNMMGKSQFRSRFPFKQSRLRRGTSGMPNMMDPSMMFNMGMNGGLGMNPMMNMGMGNGMGGMGGFGGMMNGGGYGGPNNGFNGPNGYNNQNFGNQMNQNQNFRNDRGFGGRPYGRGQFGRGRGFNNNFNRGRGGYGGFQNQNQNHDFGGQQQQYGHDQNMMNSQQYPGDMAEQSVPPSRGRASPTYEPMNGAGGDATKPARDQENTNQDPDSIVDVTDNANEIDADPDDVTQSAPEQNGQNGEKGEDDPGTAQSAVANDAVHGEESMHENAYVDESAPPEGMVTSQQDQSLDNTQAYNQNFGFGPRGRGGFRGRGGMRGGRGGFNPMQSDVMDLTPAPAPPVNAPSGPKAMREGRPNTGFFAARQPPQPVAATVSAQKVRTPSIVTASHNNDTRSEKEYRDRDHDDDRSRSRSRERSKHRSSRHRHHDDSEDYETEEQRRHRKEKERSSKHRSHRDRGDKYDDDDEVDGHSSSRKGRSSREESRSRRDRKRRHRSRSRSPNADEVKEERRKSTKSERGSKYEEDEIDRVKDAGSRSRRHSRREDEHRHSRSSRGGGSSEKLKSVIEPESDAIGFKIKGSTTNRSTHNMAPPPPRRLGGSERRSSSTATTEPTSSDPYAAEREKRHAERVAKEEQRRSGGSSSLGKRMSRDGDEGAEGDEEGGSVGAGRKRGRKERRSSVRYEDELEATYR